MQKRKKSALRRTRQTLIVLLPVLILIMTVLMIVQLRMNAANDPSEDLATAETDVSADLVIPPPESESVHQQQTEETDPEIPVSDTETEAETTELPEEIIPEQEPVTLLFTGDVLLSDYVLNNYDHSGIEGVLSPELLEELRNSDVTVINNEFPFSTRGSQAPDKQYTFRVNPKYISILTEMGVDIAGIANNHVLDYGPDALLDTFATLDQANIDYMGAGNDLARASALITKEIGGQTFGFLAASRVIPVVSWDIKNASPGVFTTYDPTILLSCIQAAKESCDYLTVFVHWGIERDAYPQDYQVTMAKQYIDAGADLVIGSHPHVLQGISYYKNKPICYSLGNFIFNRDIPKTAAVKVTIDGKNEPEIRLLAATAGGARTVLCDDPEKTEIYDYIESISSGITISEDGVVSQP